jgi:tRNA pseudouridine55 synthase
VDKPEGWTSHDVVAFLRRVLGTRRVGHGGTLDPAATGLLVVLYGRATKLADALHRARKTYLADVALGHETTTDDREGEPTLQAPVPPLDDALVRERLASFIGIREQVPPAFSALHVDGQRAYARARRGETVTLAARRVEIDALELLARSDSALRLRVTCSAGTYVRALARDVGRALGTRAHLAALRREQVGPFSLERAAGPAAIRQMTAVQLGTLIVDEASARRLLTGEQGVSAGSRDASDGGEEAEGHA